MQATQGILNDFETLRGRLEVQDTLPETPDAVIVCGSDLLHVADIAAHLYHKYARRGQKLPFVISGGHGKLTPPGWSTEAEVFGARMTELGVPLSHLILEAKADTLTSNVRNSKQELGRYRKEAHVSSLIITTDDAQLRRAVLTAQKEFPGVEIAGYAPGHFDVHRAPEGWPIEEWRQRLLWMVVNELGRLVKYQEAGTAEFSVFAVSKDHVQAAIRIGDHLMKDRSIPERAQRHLETWIFELQAALEC
jgi:uncharacterized SAM-binding protein YcdF (DUF218 family)